MSLTKTVHPPGGAAALLCAIDDQVRGLGWFYIVVQIVAGLEILAVACLFNNVQRKYPAHWWTAGSLRAEAPVPVPPSTPEKEKDAAVHEPALHRLQRVLSDRHVVGTDPNDTGDIPPSAVLPAGTGLGADKDNMVLILPSHFALPKGLVLTEEEEALLVSIQDQLRDAAAEQSPSDSLA